MKSCVALIAFIPFVLLPAAFDPAQAPRALAFSIACGVALLVVVFARKSQSLSRRTFWASTLGLGALALAVLSASVNGPASAVWGVSGRFLGLAAGSVVLLAAVSGYVAFAGQVRRMALALSVALIAESIVVIGQSLTHASPDGTLVNPVLTGAWLAVASGVSLASARVERGHRRALAAASALAGIVALALTGSRGAWLGLAGGLLFVFLADKMRRRSTALVGGALLLVLLLAVVVSGSAAGKLRLSDLSQGSGASRLAIWSSTGSMIADNPLLGVGPGRFLFAFPAYQSAEHARLEAPDMRADQAHSLPLQLAAENGIPAALLVVVVGVMALGTALRGARSGDASSLLAGSGLAAYLAQGVFGISTMQTDPLAWLLVGVVFARSDALASRTTTDASRVQLPLRAVGLAFSAVLVLGIGSYVVADGYYGASQAAFRQARFDEARSLAGTALRLDPLADVYRVGLADVCAARLLSGSPKASPGEALAVLQQGLRLEPRDFDLAIARARLLRDSGATAPEVASAFQAALALYPRGMAVRYEAIEASLRAGDAVSAKAIAEDVLRDHPQDAFALSALGRLTDG